MKVAEVRPAAPNDSEAGMTLVEVMTAFFILTIAAVPLVVALADAHRRVGDSRTKRIMKQLIEYKLSHVLLDRPEDEEPIYVDGAEGNFGEHFEAAMADEKKTYWFDESLYNYSFRIDSEEIDLGTAGGITGEEEEFAEPEPTREPSSGDAGGSPFGSGEEEEEDLGQLRYLVTLTVYYRPGNANFDQQMSLVTYVRHPQQSEAMTGPQAQGPGGGGGPGGGEGLGEARVGGAGAQGTNSSRSGVTSVTSGGNRSSK